MFVFWKIWSALFSWNTHFEILSYALLPTKYEEINFLCKFIFLFFMYLIGAILLILFSKVRSSEKIYVKGVERVGGVVTIRLVVYRRGVQTFSTLYDMLVIFTFALFISLYCPPQIFFIYPIFDLWVLVFDIFSMFWLLKLLRIVETVD